MKITLPALFTTTLLVTFGFMVLASTGCGTSLQSTNDSDRPWNETRGFQHQGASRDDR